MPVADDVIRDRARKVIAGIYSQREEILQVFVARYICEPDEIVQSIITEGLKTMWWAEKKMPDAGDKPARTQAS